MPIHALIPLDAIGDIAEIQSANFANQSSIPAGVPDLRCHLGRMRWSRGMRGMAAWRLLAWCARHGERLACIVQMARRTNATNADMQRRQAMASSKMVNDRQRAAMLVAEAAEIHGAEIGGKLEQVFTLPQQAEDEAPIPWAGVVRHIGRSIRAKMDALIAADQAHLAEKADDAEPRNRRDRLQDSLYKRLTMLRNVLQAVYGDAAVHELGFVGSTPQGPIALCRLGRVVLANLPALAAFTPLAPGLSFDASLHASAMAAEVEGLETALVDLAREAKELDATQVHKDQLLAEHDNHFAHGARALEALFTLAGAHELAARVRPSLRRPGRIHEDPDSAPDAPNAPGTEPTSEPAPTAQPAA